MSEELYGPRPTQLSPVDTSLMEVKATVTIVTIELNFTIQNLSGKSLAEARICIKSDTSPVLAVALAREVLWAMERTQEEHNAPSTPTSSSS